MRFCLYIALILFSIQLSAQTYVVSSAGLNVRSCGSSKCDIIGVLKQSEKVFVVSKSKFWAKISFKNDIGYVSTKYLVKVVDDDLLGDLELPERNTIYAIIGVTLMILIGILVPIYFALFLSNGNFKLSNWEYLDGNIKYLVVGVIFIAVPGMLTYPKNVVVYSYAVIILLVLLILIAAIYVEFKIYYWKASLSLSDFREGVFKIFGISMIIYGGITFFNSITGLSFEDWNLTYFYDQFSYAQSKANEGNWVFQSILMKENFQIYKEFFGNTANNVGKIVFLIIKSFSTPVGLLTTGIGILR